MLYSSKLHIFVLSLAAGVLGAVGPVTKLTIANKNIAPDGFTRPTVLADGVFPGPLIKGNRGDRFQINVVDKLTDHTMLKTTSIHWHGLFQHGTNYADGPAFVTQCPIASGHSFLYDFEVPDQAGTFWYHSHLHTQYCDGLRGPLVVYDPHDPHANLYDVDDESTIITIADWYHIPAPLGPRFPLGADATLINGLGRWLGDTTAELAVITVSHGKRYRFRLVSISCDPNYQFSIDGHNMTIIEADGVNTQPHTVNRIQIYAAQRYSFVLEANQPIGNYWIRAQPNLANVNGSLGFPNGLNSAILRYVGAPISEPTTSAPATYNELLEPDLHPLTNPAAPGGPAPGDVDVAINLNFSLINNNTNFAVNGVPFVGPSVPVLLQILSGAHSAQELLPSGSIRSLPPNKVIEVSMPGGVVGGGHPLHLHGHDFSVVRSANSSVYNYKNPVRRDVVNIGTSTSDNVTIRFETNNPGPWFLHCHIDFHLEAGFALVFAEDVPDVKKVDGNVPLDWEQLCPIYDALPASEQ